MQGEYHKAPQYDYIAQALHTQDCTLYTGYLRLARAARLCTVCINFLYFPLKYQGEVL
jgi:hypothetical protein